MFRFGLPAGEIACLPFCESLQNDRDGSRNLCMGWSPWCGNGRSVGAWVAAHLPRTGRGLCEIFVRFHVKHGGALLLGSMHADVVRSFFSVG